MTVFHWETAPYRTWKSARVCDIKGTRLYAYRDTDYRRVFHVKVNGVISNETKPTIDEACRYAEELYEAAS